MPPSIPTTTITYALRDGDVALRAIEALRGCTETAAIEGLVEVIYRESSAAATVAAIAALEDCDAAMVADALLHALGSPRVSVRVAAIEALNRGYKALACEELVRLIRRDASWLVRRAALRAMAISAPVDWRILAAATDPHWRVRHALVGLLLEHCGTDSLRNEPRDRLGALQDDPRAAGVLAFLEYRWTGRAASPADSATPEDPASWCDFWDWDPAVLARSLERMGKTCRREWLDAMPRLAGHDDERVRRLAAATLAADADAAQLIEALPLLDEPRHPAAETARRLFDGLDAQRASAVARHVLRSPDTPAARLAWAIDQMGATLIPGSDEAALPDLLERATSQPLDVRIAIARLAGRCPEAVSAELLAKLLDDADPDVPLALLRSLFSDEVPTDDGPVLDSLRRGLPDEKLQHLAGGDDARLRAEAAAALLTRGADVSQIAQLADAPDARVRKRVAGCLAARSEAAPELLRRLQADHHPHVRAAALTEDRAAELVTEPGRETSWHVLARAVRLAKVPFWNLEPQPLWQPEQEHVPQARVPQSAPALLPQPRKLGAAGLGVSPLGLSGHYGLPVEGFIRGVEAGVNLMFWEPNYQTMTEFAARQPAVDRDRLHFVAGTFEADPQRVRRDAERALRRLRIDRLALFLLFWVRSWRRIDDGVRQSLQELRQTGKIAMFGLSTHSRPLAVEALTQGWNPVMVRHSAAHRGAEQTIFPTAAEIGASLITFNATCYGRLLQRIEDGRTTDVDVRRSSFTAADCYRYNLAQPAVAACWTAPATVAQLEENLAALSDPQLPPERVATLRAHGDLLYRQEKVFERLVRAR